jgi:hypothetical protein
MVVASTSRADEVSERVKGLAYAGSFTDILECLPNTYRQVLKPVLHNYAKGVDKLMGVVETIKKLEKHQANNTLPPQLAGNHLPKFEFTHEFEQGQTNTLSVLRKKHSEFISAYLEAAVEAKKAEKVFWEARLALENNILPDALKEIDATYLIVTNAMFSHPKGKGKEGTEGKVFQLERKYLKEDMASIFLRLRNIVVMKHQAAITRIEAKKDLKAAADVEMADATSESTRIQELVDKAIAAQLKKLKISGAPGARSRVPACTDTYLAFSRSLPFVVKGEEYEKRRQPKRQGDAAWPQGRGPWKRTRAENRKDEALSRPAETSTERRSEKVIRYDNPSTYPDEWLMLPAPIAIKNVIATAPIEYLWKHKFRSIIHQGPGVNVPIKIAQIINSGLRFLFPTKPDVNKVRKAWKDFENRLRWRCHWISMEIESGNDQKIYDPDYDIDHDTAECHEAAPYIEAGLEKGREFIARWAHNSEPKLKTLKPSALAVLDVAALRSYLKDNDYLVVPTDKNLGACVVTRAWFINGGLSLLNDTSKYREISAEERDEKIKILRAKSELAANFAEEQLGEVQLAAFLRSKIQPDLSWDKVLPVFYVIPKIHKNPTGFRPIIPCHSAIQNPAAKFVSKMCKPILSERPYLIKGSKHMCQRLASVGRLPHRRLFLCSGDIVACYPTIPPKNAEDAVRLFVQDHYQGQIELQVLIMQCCRLALKNLVFQFDGRCFSQETGLAMGVASSPDICNLYLSVFEEAIVPKIEEILFFGRFIDDVFAIVVADTEEQAREILRPLQYEPLKLEWSVSKQHVQFLDLLVYVDPTSNRLEHKPFRKALNHRERIPWASGHPKDVKRGTFIGEMSRLATLSSTKESYLDALKDLECLYLARGYPASLIKHWLKDNSHKRWTARLGRSMEATEALVLKSVYNRAWEFFDIHGLEHVVVDTWATGIAELRLRWKAFREAALSTSGEVNRAASVPSGGSGLISRSYDSHYIQIQDPATVTHGLGQAPRDWPLVGSPWLLNLWTDGVRRHKTIGVIAARNTAQTKPDFRAVIDLSKVGIIGRRWLVSRKRTRNLYDECAVLRKAVLTREPSDDDMWKMFDMDEEW